MQNLIIWSLRLIASFGLEFCRLAKIACLSDSENRCFSGTHCANPPETPPRAMRLDGLIPAYWNGTMCWALLAK